MAHETVSIKVADLLLDQANARLDDVQDSQPATYLALAKFNPKYVVALAEDIVDRGMDPLTIPAVVATTDRKRRYRVLEGNRRVLALLALDTPSIVLPALDGPQRKKLMALSAAYHEDPISEIDCVLFDDEEAARHWIEVRHTGVNDGVGVAGWDSNNTDAWKARHGAKRNTSGQIIDFLKSVDSDLRTVGIATSLRRLISTPEVRDAIGLKLEKGQLSSLYPASEVLKGLEHIVEQLSTGELPVKEIYEAEQRKNYAKGLPSSARPSGKPLPQPIPLEDLPAPGTKRTAKKKATKKPKPTAKKGSPADDSTTLIPKDCGISPQPPRINDVFVELNTLDYTKYPNAASVLLRVFVELSVDHHIERNGNEPGMAKLGEKLKLVADDLNNTKKIPDQLRKAIHNVATGNGLLGVSVKSMNQYVHNKYTYPKVSDLKSSWNELQPFLEALWD